MSDEFTRGKGLKLLMDTYQEQLYWHIRRIVSVHEDADDVLQNTFIKVYRSISSFKGDAKLYTWLYRIATNESLTLLKKRKRHVSEHLDGEDNLGERLLADPYWSGDKTQLALKKAISKLPEKQMLVFNLRYYDDMSYKAMSEMLETSEGALKASYHHAVKKIEQFIKFNHEDYT